MSVSAILQYAAAAFRGLWDYHAVADPSGNERPARRSDGRISPPATRSAPVCWRRSYCREEVQTLKLTNYLITGGIAIWLARQVIKFPVPHDSGCDGAVYSVWPSESLLRRVLLDGDIDECTTMMAGMFAAADGAMVMAGAGSRNTRESAGDFR